jgi:serine/threonine protein kinase
MNKTSTEQSGPYESAREGFSTESNTPVTEQTYYGSAPEEFWTELEPEDPSRVEDPSHVETVNESSCFVQLIDASELELGEQIAEGGQAHVYLAKYRKWGPEDVVVKRYKGRGVDVEQLRRRIGKVITHPGGSRGLCQVIGVSEDSTAGEVSVVMEAMQGDLRNLIDKRKDYLESANGAQMMMMPFRRDATLLMMEQIASGIEKLHDCGLTHKDLKASNIFVSPLDFTRRANDEIIHSREVELKKDLAYDGFTADVGDYESSEGIVGTGFWRAPEVLRALRDKTTPTYSTAVDVYGFGMVCYELLTGQIPFEGHRLSDYELVLSGRRPELPDYLSPEITQLLHQCWHMDPCQRPGWSQIKSIIEREFHTKSNANFVHLSEHATHQTNDRNRNSFRFKWKFLRLNTF